MTAAGEHTEGTTLHSPANLLQLTVSCADDLVENAGMQLRPTRLDKAGVQWPMVTHAQDVRHVIHMQH